MPAPIVAGLISLIPQAITTISTLIKDKKERKEIDKPIPDDTGEAITDSLKEMVSGSISSKRVMNIAGTAVLIYHGISVNSFPIICAGVVYSLGMALITYLSEKK